VHALSDVNLTVERGDFVSFIGPSGCGKTTFLRVSPIWSARRRARFRWRA
jgi:ABC-type nitrate/sulfonate/bicarbonate transport system ATPase subunit